MVTLVLEGVGLSVSGCSGFGLGLVSGLESSEVVVEQFDGVW